MPLPTPNKDETHDKFLSRCMANSTMNTEYDDNEQRYAVCNSQWRRSKEDEAVHTNRALDNVALTDIFPIGSAKVVEAAGEDKEKRLIVQVIQGPGVTLNRTVYSSENMKQIVELINSSNGPPSSRKMYINHDFTGQVRDVRDWVATIEEAFLPDDDSDKGVRAKILFRPTEDADAIYQTALMMPAELGISIDGMATVKRTKNAGDGQPGVIIEEMKQILSTDFVTEASAGGKIVSLAESRDSNLLSILARAPKDADPEKIRAVEDLLSCMSGRGDIEEVFRTHVGEQERDDGAVAGNDFIQAFQKEYEEEQNLDEFRELLWFLRKYVAELAKNETGEELEPRIQKAQDAVSYVLTRAENMDLTNETWLSFDPYYNGTEDGSLDRFLHVVYEDRETVADLLDT